MSIADLLKGFEQQGVTIYLDNGKLCARAAEGAMTAEIRDQLKAQRETILEFLLGQEQEKRDSQMVSRRFESIARQFADQTALVSESSRSTYRQLNESANRLAHFLIGKGVITGSRVGLAMPRSATLIEAVLAILKTGAAYVPLDPDYPADRLQYMAEDSGVDLILTTLDIKPLFSLKGIPMVCIDSNGEQIASQPVTDPDEVLDPGQVAYVMYTSGSTGQPKGAAIPHQAITRLVVDTNFVALSEKTVSLHMAPLGFDASTFELYCVLLNGGRLVVMPDKMVSFDRLEQVIQEEQVNTLWLTAGLFHSLVDERVEALQGITQLLAGGDVLSPSHINKVLAAFPGIQVINGYGPTENTTFTCTHLMQSAVDETTSVPIGKPINGTGIYILDGQLNRVPSGVAGELYAGGLGLAQCYLNKPDMTAEKFVPNPYASQPGERLYRTGDQARILPDGSVEFLGRIDQQIKLRGFRIELGEIETVISQHEGVRDLCVIAREDRPGDKQIVAYLVAAAHLNPPTQEEWSSDVGNIRIEQLYHELVPGVRSFAAEHLPDYMVPAAFVLLPVLPLTANGKVDRRALPALDKDLDSGVEYVAPETVTQDLLSAMWCQLLGVDRAGIHDNFFELGGHSLLATQVVSRIKRSLGINLPVKTIFELPTIEQLAEYIDGQTEEEHAEMMPVVKAEPRDWYPLSFAQQRLWFLDQLEGVSATYNMPAAMRMQGDLRIDILEKSLSALVERHESLRTVYREINNEPVQIVLQDVNFSLPVIDLQVELKDELQSLTDEERIERLNTEVKRRVQKDIETPFDLASDLMFRAQLLKLGNDEYALVTNTHHIASDGWSVGITIREFSELYTALVNGEEPSLPPLPIQYKDFACCQRQWLSDERFDQQLNYWKDNLAGLPPLLELPTDRPRPRQQTHHGKMIWFTLSPDVVEGLNRFSHKQGATLYMTMLAAYQVLMAKYSRMDDIAVGSPIANRTQEELEGLIGFFVNTLTLRSQVRADDSYIDLVEQVKKTTLGAYAHQDIPFEYIVDAVNPERNLSHSPLFQVVFALQNAPSGQLQLPGLKLASTRGDAVTAKFDLNMAVWEITGGAGGYFEYNTDLFDQATVEQMLRHFELILQQVVENPEIKLGDIRLISDRELTQQIEQKQAACQRFTSQDLAHQRFETQVAQAPESIAVCCGDSSLSYADLNEQANRLAHWLREQGVGANSLVGLSVERGIEIVIGILGILKAGGAYVPIDPNYPPERISYILEDSGVEVLLTQSQLREKLPEHTIPSMNLDEVTQNLSDYPVDNPEPVNQPDDLIYIIYTSGSTGNPKGVELTHRNVVRLFDGCQHWYGFNAEDVWTLFHSYAFDFSVWEIWGALFYGGRLVIVPQMISRSPADFYDLLADEKVTVLNQTPSAFLQLIQVDEQKKRDDLSLRFVVFGGEALELQSLKPWFARHGDERPLLVNMYGITETTVHVTYRPIRLADIKANRGSMIGEPIPDLSIYLLDDRHQLVPPGVPGEICVGGAGVARGYLNRPDLTAQRFIENPYVSDDRLYRSGDLARQMADGDLVYMGRIDNQVKVRGFRIELGEIESAINAHDQVRDSVVIVREDRAGDKRLVAYVVYNLQIESNEELDDSQVSDWSDIFAGTYDKIEDGADPKYNFTGWDSSYTGEPIPVEEMEEWADSTIERFLKLNPKDMLEIGCGTGLMLYRLLPHIEHYTGGDFAAGPIGHIHNHLKNMPEEAQKVELTQREATDFSGWDGRQFDTIIVNSIAQYFPSVDYLVETVENALAHVKPGGAIFIGDNRHLNLMETFHSSVELFRSSESHTMEQLNYRIQQRRMQEKELLLEPEFFLSLQKNYPQISHVEVMPKVSPNDNELSRYRYDAILHIAGESEPVETEWQHWHEDSMSIETIEQILTDESPEFLGVCGIPNQRLQRDLLLKQLLDERKPFENVAALDNYLDTHVSTQVSLEKLVSLGKSCGYQVEVSWLKSGSGADYQVLYKREDRKDQLVRFNAGEISEDWHVHANNPARAQIIQTLIPELRKRLKTSLPDHMVPGAFVLLETLPLTPHGKVDRRALPEPEVMRIGLEQEFVAPRNEVERMIAEIWCDVLGLEQVGVKDNFFELGGHSLLATQVVSRVRQNLQVEMTVRAIFEAPTIEGLEHKVNELQTQEGAFVLPPIVPQSVDSDIPLSFAQQRLWFLEQLEPGNTAYNMPLIRRFGGSVDVDKLEQSIALIVERHEVLRTRFVMKDNEPVQQIDPFAGWKLPVEDLRDMPEDQRQKELVSKVQADINTAYDLERGPLFRTRLIIIDDDDFVIFLSMHHIISDGWSLRVLDRELISGYMALLQGEVPQLPDLAVQYRDYTLWQRSWLTGEELERQTSFWHETLYALPVLNLPTDRPRPRVQTFNGRMYSFILSQELTQKARALFSKAGVTHFMGLMAVFEILLHRYSGQSDFGIGSPIANRTNEALESLIGFFVNTLVYRSSLDGDPDFSQLLQRVRETTLSAYAHQDIPFERLVETLEIGRDLSHSPLFQVMFILQNMPPANIDTTDAPLLRQKPVGAGAHVTAKFDLTLEFTAETPAFTGRFEYNTDLFDESTIARMVVHFERLLEMAVASPEVPVSRLPMLAYAERETVIDRWNQTSHEYPPVTAVHHLFEAQLIERADEPAVVFESRRLNYRELNEQANSLAHCLIARGVGRNTLVAICLNRSERMVIAALAVLKAGAAYVPIDPNYPPERIEYMLDDSNARVLISESEVSRNLPVHKADTLCMDECASEIAAADRSNPDVEQHPDDMVYVIYTSGSTGQPKGVAMRHRVIVNLLQWQRRSTILPGPVTTIQFASLSFDVSHQDIFYTLGSGGKLVVLSEEARLDPQQVLDQIDTHQVERIIVPFVVLNSLAQTAQEENRWPLSLREVITSGEQLQITPPICELFSHCDGSVLHNQYGPAETHVCSCHTLSGDPQQWPSFPPIGRPIDNATMYVLDEHLEPVPVGAIGEIYIGRITGLGYHNRPEMTAEKFIADPYSADPDGRLYRTGDLGCYLSDGSIEYAGRTDFQVKIRGFRVEPGEIEALINQHEAVSESVVLPVDGPNNIKQLVAYVVGESVESTALRRFLADQMPDYMVPSFIVPIDSIPVTPNGKIDRRALEKIEFDTTQSEQYVAPKNAREETIADIWQQVLKLDQVGVESNFFDLGGHSLLATQVVSRVREALQVDMAVKDLFENPTIAGLSDTLAQRESSSGTLIPLEPVSRDQALPMSFAQQRMWMLWRMHPQSYHYNMPFAMRITGAIDIDQLERALKEIVRRHEILRTTYSDQGGQNVQLIQPADSWEITRVDLSGLQSQELEDQIRELAGKEAMCPFDLVKGPVFRVSLLVNSSSDVVLLATIHHIACDGWSMGVFSRELTALYKAFADKLESPLPELKIQYADFSAWNQKWMQSDQARAQLAYWKNHLSGAEEIQLPVDLQPTATPSHRGGSISVALPPDLCEKLQSFAREQGVSLFMLMMGAWTLLLNKYSGQVDISLGTPIASRNHSALEPLIGFFANTLVIRLDLSGDPSFLDYLARVEKVVQEAFEYQDTPFEKLVDELVSDRTSQRNPLVQSVFAMQNMATDPIELGDVVFTPVKGNAEGTVRFELEAHVWEMGSGLLLVINYSKELFHLDTIRLLGERFTTLLESIVTTPADALSNFSLTQGDDGGAEAQTMIDEDFEI